MVMSLPNHFLTDEVLCFSLCFTSDMSPKPKVVVIGAGIAGLSAASKLHKSGQVEACVLEASERVGGRIHSGKIGENEVEFGAAWIHGTVGNPVFDLACDLGLLSKSDKEWMNEDSRTKPKINAQLRQHIDDQLLTEVWNVFYSLISETEDLPKMRNFTKSANGVRMTVGDYLNQGFQSYLGLCTTDKPETKMLKRSLFSFLQERECNSAGTNSLTDLNLEEFGEYIFLDGLGFCPIPSGYDNIVKALPAELSSDCVHCNHEVTRINWTTTSELDSSKSRHPVKILCSNGKSFEADHVILTVSLGVLKEKYLSLFSPPLPTDKINVIQNLGFGYVGKIFLEFEEPFWPSDEYSIHLVWKDEENGRYEMDGIENDLDSKEYDIETEIRHCPWVRRLYSFQTARPGSNVLLAWFQGNESLQIESTPPHEVGQVCLAAIKKFTSLKSLPRLVNVHTTQWATNPWTRGSYSFLAREARGCDFDCLASPIPSGSAGSKDLPVLQLMFAGEATHRQFYGTVHGAYLTGAREAERLLKTLKQ